MTRRQVQHDMSAAYVYAITVDGVVRYIGKGRRYRVREHFRIARLLLANRAAGKKIKIARFYNRLAKVMAEGAELDEIIIADRLGDEQAFQLERDEIAKIPGGQLWNATAGGEGYTPETAKAAWTPERRAQQSEIAKRRWADPEARKKHSETIKNQWADPEYRAHHVSAQKTRWSKEGAKEAGSKASKAIWADPQRKAAISETRKLLWQDPNRKAKRSAQSKALWADPEFRAKIKETRLLNYMMMS